MPRKFETRKNLRCVKSRPVNIETLNKWIDELDVNSRDPLPVHLVRALMQKPSNLQVPGRQKPPGEARPTRATVDVTTINAMIDELDATSSDPLPRNLAYILSHKPSVFEEPDPHSIGDVAVSRIYDYPITCFLLLLLVLVFFIALQGLFPYINASGQSLKVTIDRLWNATVIFINGRVAVYANHMRSGLVKYWRLVTGAQNASRIS